MQRKCQIDSPFIIYCRSIVYVKGEEIFDQHFVKIFGYLFWLKNVKNVWTKKMSENFPNPLNNYSTVTVYIMDGENGNFF